MEDNFYEISKAWRQLDESWNHINETKGIPGAGHRGKPGNAGPMKHRSDKRKGTRKQQTDKAVSYGKAEESACGMTPAPGGAARTASAAIADGAAVDRLKHESRKQRIVKEIFDIAKLGAASAIDEPEVPEMGMDTESPAVSDIIAGIQARYPGAIIEISVTAPDGHRFTDEDIACATEVANASNVPDELGGAWAKTGGEEGEEGEEGDEEGTKPFNEAYPPSFGGGDKEEGGETEEAGEDEGSEKEEAGEDEGGEEKSEKPSFGGGDKEEGSEGGEGIESCSGISQDCITLCPEEWSAFLVKADQGMGGEEGEVGEVDETSEPKSPPKPGNNFPSMGKPLDLDPEWRNKAMRPNPNKNVEKDTWGDPRPGMPEPQE